MKIRALLLVRLARAGGTRSCPGTPVLVWDMGGTMKHLMLLTSALLMVSSTALSQVDVATDTELRVAYCLGATEQLEAATTGPNSLSWGLPADSDTAKFDREIAQNIADRRARLLGYLQARGLLASVRSTSAKSGVIAAKRRGWADGVESQAVIEGCVSKFSKCMKSNPRECTTVADCGKGNPAVDAIKRCRDNDPLPY
jgi:hypothetical protein